MFKKIAATITAGALMLGTAMPAFGINGFIWPLHDESRTVNTAYVDSVAVSTASTGDNSIESEASVERSIGVRADVGSGGESRISTGNATAESYVEVEANNGYEPAQAQNGGIVGLLTNNRQTVRNEASVGAATDALATTGGNEIKDESEVELVLLGRANNYHDGPRIIQTGNASATSATRTVVNARISGLR